MYPKLTWITHRSQRAEAYIAARKQFDAAVKAAQDRAADHTVTADGDTTLVEEQCVCFHMFCSIYVHSCTHMCGQLRAYMWTIARVCVDNCTRMCGQLHAYVWTVARVYACTIAVIIVNLCSSQPDTTKAASHIVTIDLSKGKDSASLFSLLDDVRDLERSVQALAYKTLELERKKDDIQHYQTESGESWGEDVHRGRKRSRGASADA